MITFRCNDCGSGTIERDVCVYDKNDDTFEQWHLMLFHRDGNVTAPTMTETQFIDDADETRCHTCKSTNVDLFDV